MDSQDKLRCPHYQIYSERLEMDGPPAYLAIRRCLLAERLVRILSEGPEGAQLAQKLVVRTSGEMQYAFVGPDLDAVTQHTCTVTRCEEQCTPAYIQLLNYFKLSDPDLEEVTCRDHEEETGGLDEEAVQPSTKTKC